MKRLAREPLVHFLVLGGLLFLGFTARERGAAAASNRIVVTPGRVEHLVAGFTSTWQRPPNADELKGLVDDFVREEMATREALAMKLDSDDTIIRRRLRQKFEFLVGGAATEQPTDAELGAWLHSHADAFRLDDRVSFRQVCVSRDRGGDAIDDQARRLLAELRRLGPDAPIDQLGDRLMLPQEVTLGTRADIAHLFGDAFAEAVTKLEPGQWTGPIESGFGPHLVLVRERVPGRVPQLAEIRPLVERRFLAERREHQLDAAYGRLLAKYQVVYELEKGVPTAGDAGRGR